MSTGKLLAVQTQGPQFRSIAGHNNAYLQS